MKFREWLQNVFAENKGERQLLNAMSANVMPSKDNDCLKYTGKLLDFVF